MTRRMRRPDLGYVPAMSPSLPVDLRVDDGRLSAVLVLDVSALTGRVDVSRWTPGPLPVVQPSNRTTQRLGHDRATDEETRRTLVAGHQADALYGKADFERWHLLAPDGGQLVATELVMQSDSSDRSPAIGFLAVHVLAPADVVSEEQRLSWWAGLLRDRLRQGEVWDQVAEQLGCPVTTGARIRHLTFTQTHLSDSRALALAYAMVGGLAEEVSPDVLHRSGRYEWTLSKPDWSALVLRDGASFVVHQASNEQFGPTLRMLVHSVHLDALLLALLQRRLINRSGNRATEVDLNRSEELVGLEQAHYDFRRKYWRTSITEKRTAPPDVILRAFQVELLTTQDVNDVEARVREGARLSRSLSARQQELAQQELKQLVQDVAVIIGSFSLCYTAAPVLTEPSWSAFLAATGLAILFVLVAFAFLILTGRRPAGRNPHETRGEVPQ